jgi:hypothetical protein
MLGSEKSLPEIMRLVQTFASYFTATDYQAPSTET